MPESYQPGNIHCRVDNGNHVILYKYRMIYNDTPQ